MYKNHNFIKVLILIAILAFPLISNAQARERESESPSLTDTLQWVTNNLENYQFGHDSLKFTYLKPIIDGCKITITDKYESVLGVSVTESTVTGMLSDIHPDFIIISNASSISPVRLTAYLKKNSTPFDRQGVTYGDHTGSYTKEFFNYEDDWFVLHFHNQTLANKFKKAITHAAKLCAQQQEGSKSKQDKELF